MANGVRLACVLFVASATWRSAAVALDAAAAARGALGLKRQTSLQQAWSSDLEREQDTPITRVVKLLEEMQKTLKTEQEEDEELYDKMACWCSNGAYEKKEAIEKNTAKAADLESSIESLTAKSAECKKILKETEAQVAADKKTLSEAQAIRDEQQKKFHAMEVDSVQQIENLKAAILVLGRHFKDFQQISSADSFLALKVSRSRSKARDSWTEQLESDRLSSSLDAYMSSSSSDAASQEEQLQTSTVAPVADEAPASSGEQLLQQSGSQMSVSLADQAMVKHAYDSAVAYLQATNRGKYYPGYEAQSGAILGIMKQMNDEMQADLKAAQKIEARRAAEFADLRSSKTEAIEKGEKIAETKEDEIATTDNDLAEAKEDLGVTKETLAADTKFLANLEKMCAEADAAFAERKKARTAETKAVAETIEILTSDEARDAASGTYSFLQVQQGTLQRKAAAAALRRAAATSGSRALSVLATSVELDAFTKVKQAIDEMIEKLKLQQEDEVKKLNFCKEEIQENEMATMKTQTEKEDLEAKAASLESKVESLKKAIAEAKAAIADAEVDLQRASMSRKKENYEFQTTVADQTVTINILKTALDRLATFYDSSFMQRSRRNLHRRQTPPVPMGTYGPSKGAGGVMQMIEKLIYEAKELRAASQKDEMEAETAYEQLVADTNSNIETLNKQIATDSDAKSQAVEDLDSTKSDLDDTEKELATLKDTNKSLHEECDYTLKNFPVRQEMRGNEIEALQQAKQILNGADLS